MTSPTLTIILRILTKFLSVWRSSDTMCLLAVSGLERDEELAAAPIDEGVEIKGEARGDCL